MTKQLKIPQQARVTHDALAHRRRGEAERLLGDLGGAAQTPNQDVQATIALTMAVLALEAQVGDLGDVIATAGGLMIDQT